MNNWTMNILGSMNLSQISDISDANSIINKWPKFHISDSMTNLT